MRNSSEEINNKQWVILDDLEMLREDLVGELQAINQYHGHILILRMKRL